MKKILLLLFAIFIIIITFVIYKQDTGNEFLNKYEQHKDSLKMPNSGSIQDDTLVTHLPIISINTNNQKVPGAAISDDEGKTVGYELGDNGEEEILVNIKIFDNNEAQNNINNEPEIESTALFKIRGNSSRYFAKKGYKISFVNENNIPEAEDVMGMGEAEEWALNGPFLDKTLLRNYMWHNIGGKLFEYSCEVRFCECYIDGEYQGLYVMMETIEKGLERVNISTYDENSRTNSYLLKLDKQLGEYNEIPSFASYTSHMEPLTTFSVLYPGRTRLTDEIKSEISREISEFEKALYSFDFKDSNKGYAAYIDVNSWVDFYILQEFLCNNDMCSRSTYLYKEKGGKLAMGPLWDFNNVCNNYLALELSYEGFQFAEGRIWYEMLLKDEKFVKKVQERYKQLRKTYLSEEYLINYIDETIEYLGDAISRNYQVWGYVFERENQNSNFEFLRPIERNPQSYEEAVNEYKEFIIKRGEWLDDNIDNLLQYCHKSKNKIYVE